MGLFSKFGSFGGIFGGKGKSKAKTAPKRGTFSGASPGAHAEESAAKLRETVALTTEDVRESVQIALAKAKLEMDAKLRGDFSTGPRWPKESLWDIAQKEMAEEALADWERRQRYVQEESARNQGASPELKFLWGEIVHVTSTNVDFIQFDKDREMLYIGYKNGAWYVYYDVDVDEALSLYNAPSKGGWVWDELRVRGTVFGFKKHYAFLEYNLAGGYRPKYMDKSGWQTEHGSIPPSGETPMAWQEGKGPYPPWYGVPSPKAKPLPMATIFGSTGGKKQA